MPFFKPFGALIWLTLQFTTSTYCARNVNIGLLFPKMVSDDDTSGAEGVEAP